MAGNDAFFTNMKVAELRKFLKERGIQISVNGKSRKRAELLELCKNAAEIKVPELEKKTEQCDELITLPGEKLLPHPFSLKFWTHDFTGISDFRIPIAAIIWLEKMVTKKTVYGRIKVLRGFAYLLRGMGRIWRI